MDSIHQLSTSLPGRRRNEQPHELLSDFKAAALSVTNLYKSAATAQSKSRTAGYQDALDDLLTFLDQENLGLMDGEGWRVREWATAKLVDDGVGGQRHTGSDDEQEDGGKEEEVVETRRSSPEVVRNPAASAEVAAEKSSSGRETASEPPVAHPPPAQAAAPTAPDFTFRANPALPSNHDREGNGMDLDNSSTDTIRIIPKSSRSKHTNHPRQRHESKTLNFSLGSGAGSKRKMPYPELFDIEGIDFDGSDSRRDGGSGGRGGKKSRHI